MTNYWSTGVMCRTIFGQELENLLVARQPNGDDMATGSHYSWMETPDITSIYL